jgi:asparagine synthase (glutamine-hydrolysing)
MAGIAGVIGVMRPKEAEAQVEQMLSAMNTEPFYKKGCYRNEELGLCVGWLVHPNSFSDCMPVQGGDGNTTIVLSGEVFTSEERLQALRRAGHLFSDTDATHLGHLYDELGDAFFEELNGTFSGILVNARARKIQLFNDRMGFERIYFSQGPTDELFHFASESKALLKVIPRLREFDRNGLAQFLSYGCTFEEATLYKGVSVLPPASLWEFSPESSIKKRTYFRPSDWQTDLSIGPDAYAERFNETFMRVLPRYFSGKLRQGMSLTGGWDTRMIMACQQAEPFSLPCYTFGPLSGDTADVQQARKVAELAHQKHQVLRLRSDFLTNFAEHASKTVYVSDGNGTVSLSHEIYLNRMAREIAGVRVTGNFGSEVLRGVTTFKALPLGPEWAEGELREEIGNCTRAWNARAEVDSARFAIFTEVPWKHATTVRLANSQLPVRSPFLDSEIMKLACMCSAPVRQLSNLPVSLIRSRNPAYLGLPTDRGDSADNSTLQGKLRKAVYAGTFKVEYRLNEGAPDFLSLITDSIGLNRMLPLQHRYLNYRQWFGGPLRGFVEDTLGKGNSFISGLIGIKAVDRALRNNASGLRNRFQDINMLLSLQLIEDRLLRQTN